MKFIVCYENTSVGNAAVLLAIEHAKIWGNVVIDVVSTLTREEVIKHRRLKKIESQIADEIQRLFEDTGIYHEFSLLTDDHDAGEQIVIYAKRKKADLIFLGLKKRSRVGKMLFGSNAQFIILNAACPVVTTR